MLQVKVLDVYIKFLKDNNLIEIQLKNNDEKIFISMIKNIRDIIFLKKFPSQLNTQKDAGIVVFLVYANEYNRLVVLSICTFI
ncbi:MAG: hypothetical protein QW255_04875 [Candidatus Bilamarchaeaceae archaeon]